MTPSDFRRIAAIFTAITIVATIATRIAGAQMAGRNSSVDQQQCLTAARKVLGESASVLRCGELNQPGVLESVAALMIHPHSKAVHGVFAKRLVVLRKTGAEWKTAVTASRVIKNDAGYLGLDYIDDIEPFWADKIEFFDKRSDGKKAFTISIQWRAFENDTDPLPTDIAWDPSVGRYREILADRFQDEVANPPHRR